MKDKYLYVVEKVPSRFMQGAFPDTKEWPWYCHMKGYDYIPVFGSIGTKAQAIAVCKTYNLDGKAHFVK